VAAVQQLLAMVTGVLESATGLQPRPSVALSNTEQEEEPLQAGSDVEDANVKDAESASG